MIGTTNSVNVKINDTVSALTNNLNSEINARQTADTTLQSNIDGKCGPGTATAKAFSVAQFVYNTWYYESEWRLVTLKCRQKQNLLICMTWASDTSSYYHMYSHWDNNHGDGMATATFIVPPGHYWKALVNTDRDVDGTERTTKCTLMLPNPDGS